MLKIPSWEKKKTQLVSYLFILRILSAYFEFHFRFDMG